MNTHRLKELVKYENLKYILKWIGLSVAIGILVAFIAVIFQVLLLLLSNLVSSLNIWIILIFPVIGLLLSGLITGFFAPEAKGHGTDAIIYAYHHKWGSVSPRVIGAKLSASIVTIGFGGSAGREGPTVQMGGGISSLVGEKLRMSLKDRRILVLCGMSASFGAIFAAPLSGALFACEVVYRDEFEYMHLLSCAISSVVGFLIYKILFSAIFGEFKKLIQFPSIVYEFNWPEIFIFLAVGLICGLVGLFFVKLFYYIDSKNEGWKRPDWVKTLIGGVAVVFLGLLFSVFAIHLTGDVNNSTLILGLGWQMIELLGNNPLVFSLQFLILVLIFKILTTSFTVGSGGSGGIVAPSVVIGALVGAIISMILGPYLSFDSRVIIGVASIVLFASIAHIPLTGMLMGGEIFGAPFIIPTLLAGVIGSWVASGDSIYHSSLVSREEGMKIHKGYKKLE